MTREDYFDKAVADSLPHWFLAAATVTFVYFLVEPGIIAPELRIKVAVVRCILFLGRLVPVLLLGEGVLLAPAGLADLER